MTRCRNCDRPIEFRATDDQAVAVDPTPIVVTIGPPRKLIQVVTETGELLNAWAPGPPGRALRAYARHWFHGGCRE